MSATHSMSASHSLHASAVARSLGMRAHASSKDSIHAPCRPTLISAGLHKCSTATTPRSISSSAGSAPSPPSSTGWNSKVDDGALQCTASRCSGSSGDSEPATSHLPSL
eukprot:7382266-Prymnesium_polylepis.1